MWEATGLQVSPSPLLKHCRISTLRFPPQGNLLWGCLHISLFHEREACHGSSGGQRAIWGKGLSPSAMWILRTELTVIIRHGNKRLFRTQEKGVNQWLQGEKFLCLVCLMSPERRLFSSHPGPEWENWPVLKHQLRSTKPSRIKTPLLNFSPCLSDEVAFAEYSAPCSSGEHLALLAASLPLTSSPSKLPRIFVRLAQASPTVWKHRNVHLGMGTLPLENYSSFLTKVYRSLWKKIPWTPFSTMTSLFSCRKPYCQYPVRIIFINVLFLLSTYTEKQNYWNSYLWARRCWSPQTQEPSRWWFVCLCNIKTEQAW